MGLLDSVLGTISGGKQVQDGSGAGLGGLENIGSLINLVSSNPQLLQAITSLLSNDGATGRLGGLEGLVAKFQQAGLGDVIGSWIGNGHNQNITGEQLSSVLGGDTIGNLARKMGVSPDTAASQLSHILPSLIDHLTPLGHTPSGGLGDSSDFLNMLGSLQNK